MDGAHGRVGEFLFRATGNLQAMADVIAGFGQRQRIQVIAGGDALRQLAQIGPVQHLIELRLAHQNDLQQLGLVRFQVGQEPHLLQYVETEVLRLVDQHDHPSAPRMGIQQVPVERIDQLLETGARPRVGDVQLITNAGQQLAGIQARIEDQRDVDVFRELVEQRPAKRGLAGSHLAGEHDKAAADTDPVQQMRQRLPMLGAEIQIAGIGRDRKGKLGKPKVLGVHAPGRMTLTRSGAHFIGNAGLLL